MGYKSKKNIEQKAECAAIDTAFCPNAVNFKPHGSNRNYKKALLIVLVSGALPF